MAKPYTGAPIPFRQIDASKVSVTKPTKSKRGGSMLQAYINYSGTREGRLVFQTPRMNAPWGIKEWEKQGQDPSFSLGIPFLDTTDPEIQAFRAKLKELDNRILQIAVDNSADWFNGKTLSEETIKDKLSCLVKDPSDEKWSPLMSIKCFKQDEDGGKSHWFAKAYGEDLLPATGQDEEGRTLKGLDCLEKGDDVIAMVEVGSLFINSKSFGPTMRLQQALIFKTEKEKRSGDDVCNIVFTPGAVTPESHLEDYKRVKVEAVEA
jgi:hypothetical protein